MSDAHLDADLAAELIRIRRHLHRHPELSNEESETQAFLREALLGLGLVEIRDVISTGLVVDVRGAKPGANRMVVVRADIDALPIHEDTGLPFASQKPGVMHACGHDAHAAMVAAAAAAVHRRREAFSGLARFIFQPAEEAEPLGARRVVEAGLLDGACAAFGIHVDPYLDTGLAAVAPGAYTLGSDIFDIRLTGRSAHAATPHLGRDALQAGAAVAAALRALPAAECGPFDEVVLSVTSIQAGSAYNIIADKCLLRGTFRTGSAQIRERISRRINETVAAIAKAFGVEAELEVTTGEPPVVNHPQAVQAVRKLAEATGAVSVEARRGWEAADDFGFYSERNPAAYFRLGVRGPDQTEVYGLHHPKFTVDETALVGGARLLSAIVVDVLEQGLPSA